MSVDETITFSLAVKNTGNREGQEIVQLYISDKKLEPLQLFLRRILL